MSRNTIIVKSSVFVSENANQKPSDIDNSMDDTT